MPDGDLAYLSSLSDHPDRPGDTSNFNPAFAGALANAIRQARAAGLPVTLNSGFREAGQTGSAYDAGGNSSHTYGLASDIGGLDGPNGKITNAWAQIAQANGLHNPYGVGDKAEFNHWQLPPQPLEKNPTLLASLKDAKATGDMSTVWSAYNAPSRVATSTPTSAGASYGGKYSNDQVFNALFGQESNYGRDPRAGGNVLQIQPGTWGQYATSGEDINNRADNMTVGHRIVDDYMNRFGGDPARVATAYFSGPGNVAPAGSASPFVKNAADPNKDVSSYVSDVMGRLGAPPAGATPTTPASPATPGTTLTSNNLLPGFTTPGASNQFKTSLEALDKATGGSGDAVGGQQDQPRAPQMGPPPMARNVSGGGGAMLPQSAQLAQMVTGYTPHPYGNTINTTADPMAAQIGQQPQAQQASPYGTSLAGMQMAYGLSPQQLQMLMNPMMLSQEGGS